MYIRRKIFSILDTEVGERLFSTTDYVLDQREFTGETKRRNKALKRQWLEKLGQERWERINNSGSANLVGKYLKRTRDSYNTEFGQKGAGDVALGRIGYERSQKPDELAWKERRRRQSLDGFKEIREEAKQEYMNKKSRKTVPQSPKPTTPNPEVVVPEKALVVSNSKPVIKTESKLSKLAKNKYAQAGAGLLVLGGTAAGGYYLLNKKKNKKDKEDKE